MNSKFILSQSKVITQYNLLKKYCDTVSYSFKTNPEVGNILKEKTNCNFSVHSIDSVNQLNCTNRLWYFTQGLNKENVNELLSKGVTKYVVDNINDLNILLDNLYNQKIDLLLRMKLKEHTIHTGKHFVYGMFSKKINELLPLLKQNKNITKLGIHFHRKTQNVSEWNLLEELTDSINNWDLIDIVNIGGGLPSIYKNFRHEVLESIFKKISKLKEFLNNKNIEMIIEPGRFIAAPSVTLNAHIINIYDNNIIVDCSIFNAALDTWISHIRLLVQDELEKGESFTIKGITPDSADIFRYKVYLDRAKVKDKIIFLNAGAYNFSTNFCNLKKIPTVIVD
jgi:ornithine decarboxylase